MTIATGDEACPSGFEPLISLKWTGTQTVCVSDSGVLSTLAIDEHACSGTKIESLDPIDMTKIAPGITPCVKRGGPTLLEN